MLYGKFNQQQIVDDGKREHRGIQERNQEKPRGAESAREANYPFLPRTQIQGQSQLSLSDVFFLQARSFFPPVTEGDGAA